MQRVITSIEQQKKNPDRVNVFLNDQFVFGLHKYVACTLKVGDILDDSRIRMLEHENKIEEAFQKALKLLSFRPRTEYEMRSRLEKYGFTTSIIEDVIKRLGEKEYIDDQKFAEEWAENRSTFRPRGRRLLERELRLKNVGDEQIQSVLDDLPDEIELARVAAKKYGSKLKGLDEVNFKKKLYGFLTRRGFLYEDIKPVMEEMWEESGKLNLLENEVINDEW